MVPEKRLHAQRFRRIVDRRGCAVRVDIVDARRCYPRLLQRHRHRSDRAVRFFRLAGEVIRVGREAVADQLGVNRGAALPGAVEVFEDHDPRALAHDEPVTILVEGPAGLQRLVVPGRERAHRGEAADAHRGDRRLGAPRDHHVGIAATDDLERFADRVRGCGAGGTRRQVGPARVEPDGDLARCEVDDGRRDEERRDTPRAAFEKFLVFALDGLESADAGGNVDADAIGPLTRHLESRIVDGELRGGERVLDEDVHLLDVFLVDELQRIERLDLARDTRRVLRRVETGNGSNPASPCAERVPVRLCSDGERGHQPDARHHHSPAQSASVWVRLQPDAAPGRCGVRRKRRTLPRRSISWSSRATRCTRSLPSRA